MSVTLNNYGKMANMNTAEFYGKSTDEKPTEQNGGNIINGSIYVEIDTGRAYFYDAEMKMWTPVTPPSADGTYTKEQIDALLNKKMSYYIVTVDGNKIVHEGEVLTYAKIQQLYEDESVFIYMEHAGLTLIPSVDVDNSIIAFSSDWMRKEGTGYEPFIYVVQITSDNTVTSQQFQIEDAANKVTAINSRNATSEGKYPSVKAVVDYVDKDGISSEITDIKEDLDYIYEYDFKKLETSISEGRVEITANFTANKFVDNTNGEVKNGGNTVGVSQLIRIPVGTKTIDGIKYLGANIGWAFYDINNTFISGGIADKINEIPTNAIYFRTSKINQSADFSDEIIIFNTFDIKNKIDTISATNESVLKALGNGETEVIYTPTLIPKSYINYTNGELVNAGNTISSTDYIQISQFSTTLSTTLNCMQTGNFGWAFYDKNKTYISGGYIKSNIEIPENAVYWRCSSVNNVVGTVRINNFRKYNELLSLLDNPPSSSDVNVDKSVIIADVFTDKTVINNKNIEYTTGNAVNNNNFVACDYIEVKPNTTYHVLRNSYKVSVVGNLAFYDANYQYISGQGSNWTDWTTPEGCKYVRFSVYIQHFTQETFSFDGVIIVEGNTAKAPNDKVAITNATCSPLYNKKWIGIGDSITEVNERTDLHYHDYITSKYGMNFVNMGVGGSGYINRQNQEKAFYQRCTELDTDADIITVFGGVNDCTLATAPIGEATDTETTTWCGCVNALIDSIRSQYVYAPLGIISPLPCDWQTSETSHPTQLPSDKNCNMSIFVEKLKEICSLRGVPFLDLFHTSNMRPENADFRKEYFSCWSAVEGDGLHPNNDGHKLFYRKIEKFIETLLVD